MVGLNEGIKHGGQSTRRSNGKGKCDCCSGEKVAWKRKLDVVDSIWAPAPSSDLRVRANAVFSGPLLWSDALFAPSDWPLVSSSVPRGAEAVQSQSQVEPI